MWTFFLFRSHGFSTFFWMFLPVTRSVVSGGILGAAAVVPAAGAAVQRLRRYGGAAGAAARRGTSAGGPNETTGETMEKSLKPLSNTVVQTTRLYVHICPYMSIYFHICPY